jgi:hypothetical protein
MADPKGEQPHDKCFKNTIQPSWVAVGCRAKPSTALQQCDPHRVEKSIADFFNDQGHLAVKNHFVQMLVALRLHLQGVRIDLPLPKPLGAA